MKHNEIKLSLDLRKENFMRILKTVGILFAFLVVATSISFGLHFLCGLSVISPIIVLIALILIAGCLIYLTTK